MHMMPFSNMIHGKFYTALQMNVTSSIYVLQSTSRTAGKGLCSKILIFGFNGIYYTDLTSNTMSSRNKKKTLLVCE